MSELNKLNTRLDAMKLKIRGVFPGTGKNITKEQLAKELNKALDLIEAGDFEVVNNND